MITMAGFLSLQVVWGDDLNAQGSKLTVCVFWLMCAKSLCSNRGNPSQSVLSSFIFHSSARYYQVFHIHYLTLIVSKTFPGT